MDTTKLIIVEKALMLQRLSRIIFVNGQIFNMQSKYFGFITMQVKTKTKNKLK